MQMKDVCTNHRYLLGQSDPPPLDWVEVAVMAVGFLLSQSTFEKDAYNKGLSVHKQYIPVL
jgi:hypothetical protein